MKRVNDQKFKSIQALEKQWQSKDWQQQKDSNTFEKTFLQKSACSADSTRQYDR
ncbi:MAG TPA: hypothetical protein VK141_05930 [Nitrosomonas sp.]|nr:hypothetical protein [Nitrosomonas sp.]